MATRHTTIRDLARRLLALEAASQPADPHAHEAIRVFEKLRVTLTRFAGADGCAALLRRALALARADVPALHKLVEKADGSLEGLDQLVAEGGDVATNAATVITTHVLGLLDTFIGEALTLRLVRESWPGASWDK